MKKAVIFDMDGTILDTSEDLYLSVKHVLQSRGYPLLTKAETIGFVGRGVEALLYDCLPKHLDKPSLEACLAEFKDYYEVHKTDHMTVYPQIIPVLESLRDDGWFTAVVSNKYDTATQALAAQYFPQLFDAVLGAREDMAKKPDPAMLRHICAAHGLDGDQLWYLGDSEIDVQLAQNAGVAFLGAAWGFRGYEALSKLGCSRILNTPPEIFIHLAENTRNSLY